MTKEQNIILVAGPTASGKTSAAIKLAQEFDAVIINTDSMQVYSDLSVLTARPDKQELESAPHYLFGHISGVEAYSVAHWLKDVEQLVAQFRSENRKMIFAGGTGLYFNALLEGLSPVPAVKPDIREKWRNGNFSAEELHHALELLDPLAAQSLRNSDRQRMVRALEVLESTGKSILKWQMEKGVPLLKGAQVKKYLIMPDRTLLHERINLRFDQMVEAGAIEEVKSLLSKEMPQNASIMKAIGVPQFTSYLRNEISLEDAIERAKAATRQYAKRQCTWFNNSFDGEWERS